MIENDSAVIFGAIGMAEIDDDPPNTLATLAAAQQAGNLWVACDDDGVPVAFALVLAVDGLPHIQELDVMHRFQRRGIGARLVARIAHEARAAGAPAVTLTTFSDVPWNGPYYTRLGFRRLGLEELTPGLRAILNEEEEAGLDMDRRSAMRLEIGAPA